MTLFFIPDREREAIVEIQALTTEAIIALLGLHKSDAHDLTALKDRVPRSLNAQASLTVKDIRSACIFRVVKDDATWMGGSCRKKRSYG